MAVTIKTAQKQDKSNVIVTNRSKQMVPIQAKPPNGDFFYEEHQLRLAPGKSVTVPRRYLNESQIENCRAKGIISVRNAD